MLSILFQNLLQFPPFFDNFSLPICPPPVPQVFVPSNFNYPVTKNECDYQKCFDPHCNAKNSSVTCEGIVSCHWCQYDKDDVPLKKRYCASSSVCFRGKEGKTVCCDGFCLFYYSLFDSSDVDHCTNRSYHS